jgi:hypothetical protein
VREAGGGRGRGVPGKESDGVFVSDIDDREGVLVVVEADLVLGVGSVRAMVDDTLCIVSVAIVRIAPWGR